MTASFDSHNDNSRKAVVLSVSHAGRDYPSGLTDRLAVPFGTIRPLEDRLADRLVETAATRGFRTLVARMPRLVIDLNRAETDFEPRTVAGAHARAAHPSYRARGGLGLVPERLGRIALWRRPLDAGDLARRIADIHRPWHAAVEEALAHARRLNGRAILIDVHSMPPLAGRAAAQVVIGDRHGASASPAVTDTAGEVFRAAGLRVAINAPYAGAYMLERHGAPARQVSAIQIEVDRRLYLDAGSDAPGPGLAAMQHLVARLAQRLETIAPEWPLAAE